MHFRLNNVMFDSYLCLSASGFGWIEILVCKSNSNASVNIWDLENLFMNWTVRYHCAFYRFESKREINAMEFYLNFGGETYSETKPLVHLWYLI